ncbi:MAG: PAS domain S-box protein, partial [Dokdonella sp.]
MFLRSSQDERNLAALNAPPRSVAVIGKCLAILALSIALVVAVGGDQHVFGPPLIALFLTALVAIVLVSLRPRLFLSPLGSVEKDNLHDRAALDTTQSLFISMPLASLLVDCESRQVIAANPAAAELYGYAMEALAGLPMKALWSGVGSHDETILESPIDGLARHQRADGSVFWVETRLRCIEHQSRPAWLLAVTDAGARVNLAQSLESSERFADDLVEQSLGIVFLHDLDGTLRRVNPAFARALGYSKDELIGKNLSDLLVPRQHDASKGYQMNIHQEQGSDIVHLQRRDGSELEWQLRNRLRTAPDGVQSVLCCAIDVSERSRDQRRLLETSQKDPLTECYNRRHLQVFENDAEAGARWAAIVIEMDHSKRDSVKSGHRLGDQGVVATARMLDRMVRSEDSVVRLGGDEFVILLRRSDQATLESFAVRLQRVRDTEPGTPFTFGMATRKENEALEETIRRADRQLIERRFIERNSIRIDSTGAARPR